MTLSNLKKKKHKQPAIHIYGDFNYPKINWETRLNKDSDQCLSDTDGQGLVDIINEACAEQLVNFSTRGDNLLDLMITTFPGVYISVDSMDSLSDHDILRATLKLSHSRKKLPKRQYYQYSKGNYEAMKTDAKAFTKDKYFNGYQNKRSIEENWTMLNYFINETSDKNIPSNNLKANSLYLGSTDPLNY